MVEVINRLLGALAGLPLWVLAAAVAIVAVPGRGACRAADRRRDRADGLPGFLTAAVVGALPPWRAAISDPG